ncbi:OBP3-responsive protein 1 isoform 1 [Hibiscus syriacus]|uniref:OBP3-responsive protein 1 isoform 1 n=1 Tax=Hibiscus syriacus TaxID=106335 RepID=A0A6A3BLG9_HIBSY|nr:splicing factor SF3a60 homolog [Hibiscus syriacus]KAE8717474.1 OBP3-responsive protein 1 isoform 1 [Hibiscus syriacus]
MSSTLLEVTRAAHEDVERLERLIVKDLQNDPPTSKDRLYQSHRVRNNIDTIIATTEKLVEIYEDKDSARKDEIAALGGQTATGINVFSAFYDRLKEIREYHRKHPAARVVDANEEYEALLKEEPVIEFSGEEAFGRYLDLHELFNQYINSKFGAKIEYSAYLDIFSQPHNIPWKLKSTKQYREYMENLLEYLIYFFQRTEPLQDLDRIFSKVEVEFEEQWTNGQVQGWEKQGPENEDDPMQHAVIDLDYYSTVEELMEVGPEKLKEALAALGLKTGGTVQQRAERLFFTKHTPLDKLDKKHFAKGSHGPRQNGSSAVSQDINSLKHVVLMEAKMKKLCDLLSKTIEQTKENVVKKQALTYEEMEQEREEEETQVDTESDDDDQQIYNPLKLPMGWDGKPIPYWLYKLHGLGQEFKCEICGNYSYWGRRAFERHFKEWRHQHGMRCLGIPNTKNFNEITNIEEAQELWEKIRERQGVNKWRPDLEEEYEDKEGNIYNKKTYTDLQRQGLI